MGMRKIQIRRGREQMQLDDIMELLGQSYWAKERSREVTERALDHSICYGAFLEDGTQIGLARVVTDYATILYLADVIVHKDYRGDGIGKALLASIQEDADVWGLLGVLFTKDAQTLYEKYEFVRDGERCMYKPRG